jgi:hypothetical protein
MKMGSSSEGIAFQLYSFQWVNSCGTKRACVSRGLCWSWKMNKVFRSCAFMRWTNSVSRNVIYYISTEIYSLKRHCVIVVRNFATAHQRPERWNFTSETTSFAPSDWTNDVFSLVKNDRTGKYVAFHRKHFGAKPISIWKSKWLRDLWTPILLTGK